MSPLVEDFQKEGGAIPGHGPGKRLAVGGLCSIALPSPLSLPKLSFYTPFSFCFSFSPLHTCCWLGLKMPPLSIFSFAEEPLMEPCFMLQRGVFNQCDCPTFTIYVCVCLPLEPEGGLLMAVAMVVVMMMMRWQWCYSCGFWLSSPRLLKDSLR